MKICVTNAQGLVSKNLLELFEQTDFVSSKDELILCTDLPQRVRFKNKYVDTQMITSELLADMDIIFNLSTEYHQQILCSIKKDAYLIDLTSKLSHNKNVTTVNPWCRDIAQKTQLFGCQNMVSTAVNVALKSISQVCKPVSVTISTYQAITEAGDKAAQALDREKKHEELQLHHEDPQHFDHYIHSNVIPGVGKLNEQLWTDDELQIISEITEMSKCPVSVTTAWVPVKMGHTIAVTLTLTDTMDLKKLKKQISADTSILLVDKEVLITPKDSIGHYKVIMSRLRIIDKQLSFILTFDNLRFRALTGLKMAMLAMSDE